jgi:transposase
MDSSSKHKQGKRYNVEFKARTISMMRTSDRSLSQIGRDVGIPSCTLKWWRDQDRSVIVPKKPKLTEVDERVRDLEAEVKRLQKENKRLEMEREILKAAATWFAKESE